jgi:squalene synthase HpnC
MDRVAGENFPVASRLLPRRQREHLLALYGFARLVDEVGDATAAGPGEPGSAGPDVLLDLVEEELDRVYGGPGEPEHRLMRTLAATVRACGIPRAPLEALIAANRQDQRIRAYETFSALEGYCEKSANPVGHLVLHVFGVATPERVHLADRICTALQLTEHWQDVVEDVGRGRVYVPGEDLDRFGCTPSDLVLSPAPAPVRLLMRFEVERARALLADGAPLIGTLHGRPRWAVAAFVAGGRAALMAIERANFDVSRGPPRAHRGGRLAATLSVGWRRR